jgi:hypothetical protein
MKKTEYEILLALSQGKDVGGSRLTGELLDRLRSEQLVTVIRHGSRVSYRAVNPSEISRRFTLVDPSSLQSRAEQVEAYGDSKVVQMRSCPGFPVNVQSPLTVMLDGRELVLNPVSGAFTFISDWKTFRIAPDVIVVGVENMENFRLVDRQRHLFEYLKSPLLFVSRYPQSGDLTRWLRTVPNRYIHFGDLDLAGISIFLTEFRKPLDDPQGKRTEFFIPFDASERIARGSRERYDAQIARFGNLGSDDPRLKYLISLIHQFRRGYDQEGFISG